MVLLWLFTAFLLPPAGLYIGGASRRMTLIVSGLWATGQLVFWFFMSGAGFLLALLASLLAAIVVMLAKGRERA